MSNGQPRPSVQKRDVLRIVELIAQRGRDLLHDNGGAVARLGLGRHFRLPRILAAGAERVVELGDHDVLGRRHRHIDGRQRLIFHVGAGVQILVERAGDDFRRHLADVLGLAQRAAEIDPIEREDDIGFAQQLARVLAEHVERRTVMRRMIGREHRALLEIGHHAGAEPFGELYARRPEFGFARAAAEHDDRALRALQQRHRLVDAIASTAAAAPAA